jgi:stage II sporulation protein AB (anti-sigma F factor)
MSIVNEMRVDFLACPENEAFARMVISAFLLPLNPTLEQMGDVKTSVSEAVTKRDYSRLRRQGRHGAHEGAAGIRRRTDGGSDRQWPRH